MDTEFIALNSESPDQAQVDRAVRALADGALVAFPTETVYGLAANAARSQSVERLREVKSRAATQPFAVHIGRRSDYESFVPDPPPLARRFIRKGWPGPLTIIFQVDDPTQAKAHSMLSSAGVESAYSDNAVGIRFPDHRIAANLLTAVNAPIIASSANVAGTAPPTDALAVREQLDGKIDMILDAGPTRYKRSSTVVALNSGGYRLVRAGVLDERMIRRLAAVNILFVCTGNTCRSPMAEGFCRQMLAERIGCRVDELHEKGITIRSAGTLGLSGGRASREAVEVCRKHGVDISLHTPRGLTVEFIHPADHIFTMATHHLDVVRSLSPGAADRAARLHPSEDIADPIGGTIDDYQHVADIIRDALAKRMNEVAL